MSKLLNTVTLATAILAVSAGSALSAPGDGYGFIKPNTQNQFGGPVQLKMHKVNGNWRLKEELIRLPIQYEAGIKGLYHLDSLGVYIGHHSWNPSTAVIPLRRGLERKSKVWGTTSVTFNRSHLAAIEAYGAERCIPGKTVGRGIPVTMHAGYKSNRSGALSFFARQGNIPATFVCEQTPRTPAQVALRDMKLYALPANPVCGRPVALVAEFHTNIPGKVDFVLTRGDGEQQRASVNTTPVANGNAGRWSKTYTFNRSEIRKYMIIAQGHPLSTPWVELKVECRSPGASAGAGMAPSQGSAPRPAVTPQIKTAPAAQQPHRRLAPLKGNKQSSLRRGN